MKKLRLVILFFAAFSLFINLFLHIAVLVYDNSYKTTQVGYASLKDAIEVPFSANIFVTLVIFILVLIWYIYHRKDRAESITNFLIMMLYIAYAIIYVICAFRLNSSFMNIEKAVGYTYNNDVWKYYSLAIFITSGMWLIISIIPVILHFIASVCTGGFDNVPEPDNIYGFMFTLIGICYLLTLLVLGLMGEYEFAQILSLNENGLIYTFIVLTFILCAGLKFNFVVLDIFNIAVHSIYIIAWIVIIAINGHYYGIHRYLSIYNLLFLIPMAVLSVFILRHFLLVDRFYKGRTKNFLNE